MPFNATFARVGALIAVLVGVWIWEKWRDWRDGPIRREGGSDGPGDNTISGGGGGAGFGGGGGGGFSGGSGDGGGGGGGGGW